ncbi:FG-GAP repeat protein [Psychromonas aquatilis]|uniref:FG-GAP repeat protein n=1 Tax=Psychromonas aquatilis TaxID=2005072 RepID=A0ABU9GNN2_9GAMM
MYRIISITLSSFLLFSCASEDNSNEEEVVSVPEEEVVSVPEEEVVSIPSFNFIDIDGSESESGAVTFTWDGDSTGLTYTLCENNIEAENNCSEIATTTESNSIETKIDSLFGRYSSEYFILASNGNSYTASNYLSLSNQNVTDLIRYVKASNPDANDRFGYSASLSGDGLTLAVGAYTEDSSATGINSDLQDDNDASASGAVYIFKNNGSDWSQEAYVKASNSLKSNKFGESVSLNEDGTVLAVGSIGEDSSTTGVNSESNGDYNSAGAAYIFRFDGTNWSEEAYIKASNTDAGDNFGLKVSLSDDGDVLAIGTKAEDSDATGIYTSEESVTNEDEQANNDAVSAGAAYLFRYNGATWDQEAYIKASNTDDRDYFGNSVSLSGDGTTLAVGAYSEDSNGNDGEDDNSLSGSGAAYIFRQDGNAWTQQALIKAGTPTEDSYFGNSVSLSEDGNTLAVGAYSDDSLFSGSGAVHVFKYSDNNWSEEAYLKTSNAADGDSFGKNVVLSADGNILVASADYEASLATGIDGDQTSSGKYNGAVYAFKYENEGWIQYAYIKASNTKADGQESFGASLALSSDGKKLMVGAKNEDSAASGIDGDQTDSSLSASGAVYIY